MADGSQAGHPLVSRTSGQTTLVASPHILTGHILTVGLSAMAAGRPLRAVQFHRLAALGQQPGKPSAVAAVALHRPHPSSRMLLGEGEQGLVAGRGGGNGLVASTPPVAAATTAAVWVCGVAPGQTLLANSLR